MSAEGPDTYADVRATTSRDTAATEVEATLSPNQEIAAGIRNIQQNVYQLNAMYGNAMMVAARGDGPALARNLLERAEGYLDDLRAEMQRVEVDYLAEPARERFRAVRAEIVTQISKWKMLCAQSLGTLRPDDDLGIQAGSIALHADLNLSCFLVPSA